MNTGTVSALIKSRAADDMMDLSIASYPDRRKKFIEDFVGLRQKLSTRKGKLVIKLHPDVLQFDPLAIFLMEKEANQAFNKALLGNPDIIAKIRSFHTDEASIKMHALRETGRAGIPFFMGDVPVLANIRVAEGLLKKEDDKEVGMILLYERSEFTSGISKKSGRPWSKVSVYLSDGYNTIECVDWKAKRALGWAKNSIVYVRGTVKPGFRAPVCLDIREIQRLTREEEAK